MDECIEKDLYDIFRCISGLYLIEDEEGNLCPNNVTKQECYSKIKELQNMFSQRKELVDIADKYLLWESTVFNMNYSSYWEAVENWNRRVRSQMQHNIISAIEKADVFLYNEKYELPFSLSSVDCKENKVVVNFYTSTNDPKAIYDIITARCKKRCKIKGIDIDTYCIAELMSSEKQENKLTNEFPYFSINFNMVIYT